MVIAHCAFIGSFEDAVNTLAIRTVVELELTNPELVRLSVDSILADLRDVLGCYLDTRMDR